MTLRGKALTGWTIRKAEGPLASGSDEKIDDMEIYPQLLNFHHHLENEKRHAPIEMGMPCPILLMPLIYT